MVRTTAGAGFAVVEATDEVVAEWDRLAREVGAVPFVRPGWVMAWGAAFGHTIRLATVREGDDLVAALPVVVDGSRVRSAADWHVPATEVVATNVVALTSLLRGLDARYRRVTLDFVLDGSLTEQVGSAVLGGRPHRRITRLTSPYVDTTRPWTEYEAARSTKVLREVRRRRRRLEEDLGPVALELTDGASDWRRALRAGLELEAAGWKGEAGTAILSDPATERFYASVAEWAAGEKLLQVVTLSAGGHPVAFDCSLSDGYTTWLLKTGFDHELGRYAPGIQLRHEVLRDAFDRGLDSYEFTGEYEAWKGEWADRERGVVVVDAFAHGVPGRMALQASRAARAFRVRTGAVVRRFR